MFELATYRISILGTLDKNWSDYCGGMKIEHDIVLNQYPVTILTGILVDQAALIGVIASTGLAFAVSLVGRRPLALRLSPEPS